MCNVFSLPVLTLQCSLPSPTRLPLYLDLARQVYLVLASNFLSSADLKLHFEFRVV
jgi:hypothetical protein